MNKLLFYILSIIVLSGCVSSEKGRYSIIGSVPDSRCEGEWIYLAPYKGATAETIDSIQVKDGMFRFEGSVDTSDIRILRTRPILRFKVQELLIVMEQGTLTVLLDSVSSAHGTPQNDALQQWKEAKMRSDGEIRLLYGQKNNLPDSINIEYEQIKTRFNDFNFNFLKNSGFNTVGTFIYDLSKNTFSPEQKAELEELKTLL